MSPSRDWSVKYTSDVSDLSAQMKPCSLLLPVDHYCTHKYERGANNDVSNIAYLDTTPRSASSPATEGSPRQTLTGKAQPPAFVPNLRLPSIFHHSTACVSRKPRQFTLKAHSTFFVIERDWFSVTILRPIRPSLNLTTNIRLVACLDWSRPVLRC